MAATNLTRTQTVLTADAVAVLVATARRMATARGVAICVAVVDPAGALLGFQRMDAAGLVSIDVAIGKARTAAMLGAPSRKFEDMINAGQSAMVTVPHLVPLRGGVPVMVAGQMVGAVGISGAAGDVDESLANAVAASLAV